MQTRISRCRLTIAIPLLLALSPGGALASMVDVTRLDNDLLQIVVDEIDQVEGRVYTLDRASGEIVLGDGLQGTRIYGDSCLNSALQNRFTVTVIPHNSYGHK